MTDIRITNIVFDLGNVLVDVDYKRFTDAMGWDYDTFMRFFDTPFFREFERGMRSEEEFFIELNTFIPLKDGDEKRYRDRIHKTFSLRPVTWAKMHWLKKHYRVYLFSNTNSLDFNGIDKELDIKRILRFHYVSYAAGYIKPSPEAYNKFAEMFGINPKETLFVDDRQENIDGAVNAGWHAERIDAEADLFKVFERYGIR